LTEALIELENVKYVYPDGVVALKGVSLKVLKGERLAILGPNGAGKSTLVMHLNGLYSPKEGTVKVWNMPINDKNVHEIRRTVGIVFQNPDDQLFCPTLWEDVAFGPLNMGLSMKEVEVRVEEALGVMGLTGLEERAPHHLSLGERKRAAIATVLAMKPRVLVLDEPTANLDPRSRRGLIELLNNVHKVEGTTLVIATHDMDLAFQLTDRAYILKAGSIITEGPILEVLLNSKLLSDVGLETPTMAYITKRLKEEGCIDPSLKPSLTAEKLADIVLRAFKKRGPP